MATSSSKSNRDPKRRDGNKIAENEEIVRHMSNLPSFLERGKPIQDKALNFGVMDWGRLEKWQYQRQKQGLSGINKYSPSSSNSSFLFSTDESSPYSSRNQSSFLDQLKPHHVTLQSHLNISPEGNLEESQDVKDDACSRFSGKKTRNKSRTCKTNDLFTQNVSESKSSDDLGSFQTASSSSSLKGKMKIQDDSVSKLGNFQDSNDPETNIPNSFPFENESKERNPITRFQNTPEKKESSFSSKNSDSKTGTIAAIKQRNTSPRHRPSPFKKLFDPIFQSKPTTSTQSALTLEDSKVKARVKLDFGSCKEVKIGDSRNKKKESSSSTSTTTKQGLFQMAIKNNRPLFTFTVENNDDIVAATVRSLSEKDDANSWIYTFFTIREVKKKKPSWLSHGTKGTNQGFLPNITAQLTVSNCSVSNCREFVLSSLDPSVVDDQIVDGQPQDELAAIVVRFLEKEENQGCFSMTVVLPGGHHSVPSKGEPSPLIERWRSGGACDCGGWDIGCRLRTFTNKVESNRSSNLMDVHLTSENFELFFQGDVISKRPYFSFSPLKDGIFSVEYDSSLSLLHAFSICISVLECRKSCQHTQLKTYVAKQVDEDDEATITYASLPPVSPVERV